MWASSKKATHLFPVLQRPAADVLQLSCRNDTEEIIGALKDCYGNHRA
jgi:hypothetical protein